MWRWLRKGPNGWTYSNKTQKDIRIIHFWRMRIKLYGGNHDDKDEYSNFKETDRISNQ